MEKVNKIKQIRSDILKAYEEAGVEGVKLDAMIDRFIVPIIKAVGTDPERIARSFLHESIAGFVKQEKVLRVGDGVTKAVEFVTDEERQTVSRRRHKRIVGELRNDGILNADHADYLLGLDSVKAAHREFLTTQHVVDPETLIKLEAIRTASNVNRWGNAGIPQG